MIVTLTDFNDSEYLGVMKGVMLSVHHSAAIVDMYNGVSPQNIKEGAWILLNNYKYFPRGSIFLCVVDPGVGSGRKSIAVKTKEYYFIGPDNGLMWPAANDDKIVGIIELSTEDASSTFHGRDVFSKAAARLDSGADFFELGKKISEIEKLDFHLKGREGEIVRIDNFGNIITNLNPLNKTSYNLKSKKINKRLNFYKTYAGAKDNELFLITGSAGTLEISLKNKNANKKLKFNVGDKIEIK